MAVCEAEELELGLPTPSPSPSSLSSSSSSNAAALEALNGELGNLRLEEKSEGGDHEIKENDENVILDKDSKSFKEKGEKFPFPLRPDEPDCSYYMKTRSCRYGMNCKFNHPPSRMKIKAKLKKPSESVQKAVNENQKERISECSGQTECKVVEEKEKESFSEMVGQTECQVVEGKQNETLSEKVGQAKHQAIEEMEKETPAERVGQAEHKAVKEKKMGTLSESIGQMECKYYSMPGGCKYGNACKYSHQEKTEVVSVELNFLGLPMRPGERECPYYMRTGGCKYSTNCRFHHPDPTAVGGQDPLSGYQNGGSPQQHASPAQLPMTSWPLQRTPNAPVSFIDASPSYGPGFFLPPRGLHPNPEWNGYQAPVNPFFPTEMNMQHHPSASTMKDTSRKADGSIPKNAQVGEYPERPGQPECQYFMKTGTCKFKSACRFHHPKSRLPKGSGVDLSPMGLPLRPDQPVCTHYSRHRICKYGSSCKYDHPMDCNSSASPVGVTVYSQNIFPDSSIESQQEFKIEESTNAPIQESEW